MGKLQVPAFRDEIRAWKCGPVVLAVYYQFSSYVNSPICSTFDDIDIEPKLKEIIDKVALEKMGIPAWRLAIEIISEQKNSSQE